MPQISCAEWDKISIGDVVPTLIKTPTYIQLFMFSAVTWNRHLIHYNIDYAKHDGLNNVAVHRALLGNYLAQMFTDWVDNKGKIIKLSWSVRSSAEPGDILSCNGVVTKKEIDADNNKYIYCDINIQNQNNDVIVSGFGTLHLYN